MLTGRLISGISHDDCTELIPDNYQAQIRRGELTAMAVYEDTLPEEQSFTGFCVTGVHSGWFEIVYLYMTEGNRSAFRIYDVLQYVIRSGFRRNKGRLCGAFYELPMSELYPELRTAIRMVGMDISEGRGNVYRFRLSDIRDSGSFIRMAENARLICLKDADRQLLNRMERVMEEDQRPVAASPLVEWQEYNGDLSMICMEGGEPAGLILISEQGKCLVVELVYTAEKSAFPKLMGGALKKAGQLCPGDQVVLVPIAAKNSGEILNRLVPSGERHEALEAVMWFDSYELPDEFRELINQLKGE